MVALLTRNWWAVALRGLSALVLGLLVLVWPGPTLFVLVLLFGVYTLVDGLLTLVSVFRNGPGQQHRWSLLFEGVVDIVAGILTFVIPDVSARLVFVLLALWAISTGVAEVSTAIRLRREITGEWVLAVGGITSVLFGLLLLLSAEASLGVVVMLIAAYALTFGGLLLALAFRLKWADSTGTRAPEGTS